MIELPQELMITKDDLAGAYDDNLDCPLARALKRAGVPIGYENGYTVGGTAIICHALDGTGKRAGFYAWDNGEEFLPRTLREGKLIYYD